MKQIYSVKPTSSPHLSQSVMFHSPRDTCSHMLHKKQGMWWEWGSVPRRSEEHPHHHHKDIMDWQWHVPAALCSALHSVSSPRAGPPAVSRATGDLHSGLPRSHRATCQGSGVRTCLLSPAGPVTPVCPVVCMVAQEQGQLVKCETGEVISALVWWEQVGEAEEGEVEDRGFSEWAAGVPVNPSGPKK